MIRENELLRVLSSKLIVIYPKNWENTATDWDLIERAGRHPEKIELVQSMVSGFPTAVFTIILENPNE